MINEITNINLEQLNQMEDLTVRTYNVCYFNNLDTLKQIIDYYKEFGDFRRLRNCGRKSDDELITICQKYENYFFTEQTIIKDEFQIIIENLNVRQKTILQSFIASLLNKLTVRSFNSLSFYLNKNFSLNNIYKNIFADKNFTFKNLKNIGEKSISELDLFKNEIFEYINLISLFTNEYDLEAEYSKAILSKHFPNLDFSNIQNFIDKNSQIQIFNLINQLLENELLLDKRNTFIFKNCFDFFNNFEYNYLEVTAEKLNISRERVRQLRSNIYDEFYSIFSFLMSFDIDFELSYGLMIDNDIIFINLQKINEINQIEKSNFNNIFIHKIIHLFFNKLFDLVGNEKDILFHTDRRFVNNWNSTYLVRKELNEIFDFENFANDIYNRLNDRNTETYEFYFNSYLINFFKTDNYSLLQRISKVCETLIFSEFNLVLDFNDNLVFYRNIKKQNYEIAKEILQEVQKPLKVDEIFQKAIEKYPELETTANSLAGSMRINSGFIYFGRTSTYGLEEWENKYNDIKGGTIRDIVEEYLKQFDDPKHIEEITEYVCKFRNTSLKNISSNIRMEENNRFIFFKSNFVGLKSKSNDYIDFEFSNSGNRLSWNESYNNLVEFIKINNKFPQTTGNENEKRLYNFCTMCKTKLKLNKLNDEQIEKLKFINFPFDNTSTNRIRGIRQSWFSQFNDYKNFITLNKREPYSNDLNERNLYHWKRRTLKAYNENMLSNSQISLIKEIGII